MKPKRSAKNRRPVQAADGLANPAAAHPSTGKRRLLILGGAAIVVGVAALLFSPGQSTIAYFAWVFAGLGALVAIVLAVPRARAARLQVPRSKLFLLAGTLALCLGLAEIFLRFWLAGELPVTDDERSLLYEYDSTLGWFPRPNQTRSFTGSRTVEVSHNSFGFRGPEPVLDGKPGIMFLGDSFVWGFDVEARERFTEKLQTRHPEWNIYNLGISGYGTDQESLLLQGYFDRFKPRMVFLVFCTDNDVDDNAVNAARGGYYKPFFTIAGSNMLAINGIPVPRSERAILSEHPWLARSCLVRLAVRGWCKWRNPPAMRVIKDPTGPIILAMRNFVISKGAFFAVAMEEGNDDMKRYFRDHQVSWVALDTTNRYATFGGHWTPEGHEDVCNQVESFLAKGIQEGYLEVLKP